MTPTRLNVASGRQLEQTAHYSRALRVGDTVLQSGTTAIDRQGNLFTSEVGFGRRVQKFGLAGGAF